MDYFSNSESLSSRVSQAYQEWSEIEEKYRLAKATLLEAKAEEDYIRFSLGELKKIDPEPGEEQKLAETRNSLINNEKIIDALNVANSALSLEPAP